MKTINKHSYGFSEGMILGPTRRKHADGHRQVDWAKLKEYIETNKSEIEKVDVGLAEDWDCTSGTIFENDDYCKSGSVYGQSDWATPSFEVTLVNGSVQMFECWELGHDAYGYFDLDLPKAPETTASPSKAAADKGILTEEELKERNRLLVLENDELLEETKLRNNYESFLRSVIMGRETLQDDHDFEWFKKKWKSIKKPSLEENK